MTTDTKKMTREQAIEYVLEMENEISRKVSTQYIGMPREELKDIILTVARKTEEQRIFCLEKGLDFHEITGR